PRSTLFPYTTLFRSQYRSATGPAAPGKPSGLHHTAPAGAGEGCQNSLNIYMRPRTIRVARAPGCRVTPFQWGRGYHHNRDEDLRSEEHTSELQSPCN